MSINVFMEIYGSNRIKRDDGTMHRPWDLQKYELMEFYIFQKFVKQSFQSCELLEY